MSRIIDCDDVEILDEVLFHLNNLFGPYNANMLHFYNAKCNIQNVLLDFCCLGIAGIFKLQTASEVRNTL